MHSVRQRSGEAAFYPLCFSQQYRIDKRPVTWAKITAVLECEERHDRAQITMLTRSMQFLRHLIPKTGSTFDHQPAQQSVVLNPRAGEGLIRVCASAVNSTDVNTKTGWYSSYLKVRGTHLSNWQPEKTIRSDGWHDNMAKQRVNAQRRA